MFSLTVLLFLSPVTLAWDNDEMDLFDLVEEVNKNFYEVMGLDQASATTKDVRSAYKKLALVLHPDKNDAPDAEVKFRQLAAIYEVLKDKTKREMYDKVLVEGLPNWRNPAFYFRRMRKIGLAEGLLYLLAIATGIQYCMNWAAYWERKFTISEHVNAEVKRKAKKFKKDGKSEAEIAEEIIETEMDAIGPKPTAFDTLPFQLFRLFKYLLFLIPTIPGMIKKEYDEQKRLKEEKMREKEEYEEEVRRIAEEKQKKKEQKAQRKRVSQFKEAKEEDSECLLASPDAPEEKYVPKNANQMWTDQDLITLAKLIKKIPGGSTDRQTSLTSYKIFHEFYFSGGTELPRLWRGIHRKSQRWPETSKTIQTLCQSSRESPGGRRTGWLVTSVSREITRTRTRWRTARTRWTKTVTLFSSRASLRSTSSLRRRRRKRLRVVSLERERPVLMRTLGARSSRRVSRWR